VVIARALDRVEVGPVLDGYNITNLRITDDIAVTTETKKDQQNAMNQIARAGQRMALEKNTDKTEMQLIRPESVPLRVTIDVGQLNKASEKIYLLRRHHMQKRFIETRHIEKSGPGRWGNAEPEKIWS